MLTDVIRTLERAHGSSLPACPIEPIEPFEQVLWENIAYLLPDDRRAEAFAALRSRIGTRPEQLIAVPPEVILEVASMGGMRPVDRAERLRKIALIALSDFAGNVGSVVKMPTAQAKKLLYKFPGIGEPGAEKILMLSGALAVLALESNGLRVLLRLGFGREGRSYSATYRAVQAAAMEGCGRDAAWYARAHHLLRRHGKEICRNSQPRCEACPLSARCEFHRNVQTG